MKDLNSHIDGIKSVHSQRISLETPFIDFAGRFAHLPGTVVLLSGGDHDCARYHVLGTNPWLTLSGRGQAMNVAVDEDDLGFEADPFETLRTIIQRCAVDTPDLPPPLYAGLLGYLAYDLKDNLENLPRTSIDDTGLPHLLFYAPSILVVHDRIDNTTRLFIPLRNRSTDNQTHELLNWFNYQMEAVPEEERGFSGTDSPFSSNFEKTDYLSALEKIKDYIASGHVYQVNMSQRFEMGFDGNGYTLFKSLFQMNPAPFFAYVNGGDHQIVSTSPERFILRDGQRVETRPIKGTRPRGKTALEDQDLKNQLLNSKKDDAELSMIVDLLRNDMGKVCRGDSVHVAEHKRLEAYTNVYHLVSIVEGALSPDFDAIDILRATFPGGSITGCPKIRAMEIIDELEPNRRHVYTGSIGYVSFHDTMDFSIAIRTATIVDDRIIFSVGGGIVYDSDPADEYDETLHKGKTLMTAFGEKGTGQAEIPMVWHNGTFKPLNRAVVPVMDLGFQYGFGIFETIRVENGSPCLIDDHIQRFNSSFETLFQASPPDLTWEAIIGQLVRENGLDKQTAAVKIMASKGEETTKAPTLMVTAKPYVHRIKGRAPWGLCLGIYPHPRLTPLADHKTMNYLYYYLAGKWARQNGYDEALILNPDGSVSETNTANILVFKESQVILPSSEFVLPGVMQKALCDFLAENGFEIVRKTLWTKDLTGAKLVVAANALMGAVPVLSIHERKIDPDKGLLETILGSPFFKGLSM